MVKVVKQNYLKNKRLYKRIEKDLKNSLPTDIPIIHVGSTAIPNMYGKNIIDILIGTTDKEQFDNIALILTNKGFIPSKNKDNIYQFFASKEEETGSGDIHIHLVILNTERFSEFLLLKDYLLSNKKEIKNYSNFKKNLIKNNQIDRKEYKTIKSKYVIDLINKAKRDIKLVPLKQSINKKLYEMYQDIPKEEMGSLNKFYGIDYPRFKRLAHQYIKEEKIINSEIDTTTKRYILFINNVPIGELGIRTTLNDFWINRGSQIYYKIRLSYRCLGCGNLAVKLLLQEAKKLGFKKIRVNCDNTNIPSKKIIINNGGIADISNYKTKQGISTSYLIDL